MSSDPQKDRRQESIAAIRESPLRFRANRLAILESLRESQADARTIMASSHRILERGRQHQAERQREHHDS